jgi:bifunctional NMN adenylyltransferase/nudix hydrolase
METPEKKYDIGVIIGRFQVPYLHQAHVELFQHVIERHDKVIVLLGSADKVGTRRNPIDFLSRKAMIEETFSNESISAIMPLKDMKDDHRWSKKVDELIRDVAPIGSVVLYGARDSFIPYYHGRFDTQELVPTSYVSGTQIREEVKNKVERTNEFRAGMVYVANNTFPFNYATVDVAIFRDQTEQEILLGRKPDEKKYRFIGGFSDVTDESFESAGRREVMEETGLLIETLEYVASKSVDDWRYRSDTDRGIITTLFKGYYTSGRPEAKDDIEEVKWFNINSLNEYNLVPEHLKLLESLK